MKQKVTSHQRQLQSNMYQRSVFLVDDDPHLRKTVGQMLAKHGFIFYSSSTLKDAHERLNKLQNKHEFSVVIVDRVLPDGDGLELVEWLEADHFFTRVLVLSRQGQAADRVQGLSLGANDYLPKPFSQQELLIRLNHLCNVQKLMSRDVICYRKILFYPETGELRYQKVSYHLRPKEAKILECLIRHQGFIVTPEMLLQYVWSGAQEEPLYKTIAVYIRRIRMLFNRCPALSPEQLKTVRGVGYRLE